MSIMSGQQYPPMAFDHSWTAYQAAFAAGVYNPGNYDFTRSPNTSGGSDESLESRIDPKRSPKYAEKRKKNNEAAKKSRKQRKERELGYQKENEVLKVKNQELEAQNQELITQLKNMNTAMQDLIAERDTLRQSNCVKFHAQHAPHALRDLTNSNDFNRPKYENL